MAGSLGLEIVGGKDGARWSCLGLAAVASWGCLRHQALQCLGIAEIETYYKKMLFSKLKKVKIPNQVKHSIL